MSIIFARVDDRLIHGEVVTAWVPSMSINRIVIVDDFVATDAMNKRIIRLLAPSGVQVDVFTVEDAIVDLKNDNSSERILILTKSPVENLRLIEGGIALPQVNLGGMGIRGERKRFIKNVACDAQEIEAINKIKELGVDVFYQLVPEQKKYSIDNLL